MSFRGQARGPVQARPPAIEPAGRIAPEHDAGAMGSGQHFLTNAPTYQAKSSGQRQSLRRRESHQLGPYQRDGLVDHPRAHGLSPLCWLAIDGRRLRCGLGAKGLRTAWACRLTPSSHLAHPAAHLRTDTSLTAVAGDGAFRDEPEGSDSGRGRNWRVVGAESIGRAGGAEAGVRRGRARCATCPAGGGGQRRRIGGSVEIRPWIWPEGDS